MNANSPRLLTANDLFRGKPNAEPPQYPLVPFSKEKARQMINAGEFPAPIKIGNRNYWHSTTIDAWIDSLKNAGKK
ncbi:hypothetical protein [uncultured Zhongshania sp.]|uniref:helix-turn-helix transcriptional regulator n=1 Tax=uncultured Zhongshania sp. TaxID=1642288 RepID=UPI0030D73FB1|tara:strand:+ start:639 stop:866 length:228 start_codon:yes stop_codon:yes gene_type:complete